MMQPAGIESVEETKLLEQIIVQKIRETGPLSFRDFMEMALYYPGLGYYTSMGRIGANGDYYTSVTLTPAFGAMIGRQLEQMWEIMGKRPFTVVEFGGGGGMLCADILNYLRSNQRLYNQLTYYIVEKRPATLRCLPACLDEKVKWPASLEEIGPFEGCVLSNELVDNLPVHQVIMKEDLMEVLVDYRGEFIELLTPAGKPLLNYFSELGVPLEKDFRTEVGLDAIHWLGGVSRYLQRGYVCTIDYGYLAARMCQSRHRRGTLLCYSGHRIHEDPYKNIGRQDITTHVNFSALMHWGSKSGLTTCGFTSQAHFLLALGFAEYFHRISAEEDLEPLVRLKKESVIRHRLLIDMGNRFNVLIQRKGVCDTRLIGLSLQ
jgi:SAM-dependent MidA family methyltransferase